MNEIQTWNYEDSVKRVRPKVMKLRELTLDVYHMLWTAREHLGNQGARTDLTSGQMTRSWEGYCEDIGLSKRNCNRWLSGYDPVERKLIEAPRDEKPVHVSHNSGENEWYTPERIVNTARELMGGVDCDPASTETANEIVQAETFYDIDADGLQQQWHGRVWMNPPYGQPLIKNFCAAFIEKYESGEFSEGCVIVNNATETEWFHTMIAVASAICFLKGRVRFIDKNGDPANTPLQGQVILYFGEDFDRFEELFSKFGKVF